MAKNRSYKLLCPIARALDRIGDRWTLLILRDLHAGPARFTDLQRGLTGIAANLLTERLVKLVEVGLIQKTDAGHGASVYALTELGGKTSDIIFELALFGARFPPEGEIVKPGNLRTVATTMGAAANRAATEDMDFDAAVVIESEQMHLAVRAGKAEMSYTECPEPDLVFSTSYAALLALTEGEMEPELFLREYGHVETALPKKEAEFLNLMTGILSALGN